MQISFCLRMNDNLCTHNANLCYLTSWYGWKPKWHKRTYKQYTLRSTWNEKTNETTKEKKQAPHSKNKGLKNNDLTGNKTKKSVGYWWSLPKFYSAKEKRKTMHRHRTLLNRKLKKWKKGEEGHKIQSNKCLLFNKTDVKIKSEE